MGRPRLLFADIGDARDPTYWSGTPYSMVEAFSSICDVDVFGPLSKTMKYLYAPLKVLQLGERKVHLDRFKHVRLAYSRQVARRFRSGRYDLVISPSSIPISGIGDDIPTVFWADACFPAMVGFYEEFSNIHEYTRKAALRQERDALCHCKAAIYSSKWAQQSAVDWFPRSAGKTHIVRYGANLDPELKLEDIVDAVAQRGKGSCKVVLLAVDWKRKNGAFALEIVREARRRGTRTELYVAGTGPPEGEYIPEFVHFLGFLRKDAPADRAALNSLMGSADFLLLPSKADCSPIVLCEAAAFGVPALAARVGGIPSYVDSGRTGALFSPSAGPREYAGMIVELFRDRERYAAMAQAAYRAYSTDLNWRTAARSA
jgi:glycosyltransferase involved in cell wall biosynthesis